MYSLKLPNNKDFDLYKIKRKYGKEIQEKLNKILILSKLLNYTVNIHIGTKVSDYKNKLSILIAYPNRYRVFELSFYHHKDNKEPFQYALCYENNYYFTGDIKLLLGELDILYNIIKENKYV